MTATLLLAAEESDSPGLVDPVWGLMVWSGMKVRPIPQRNTSGLDPGSR